MSSRGRRPRSPVANRDGASASSPAPLTARTLKLFTVSDETPAGELTERNPDRGTSPGVATNKNPRWVLQREKELRSEAVRERILHLVSQIEIEEARNRPAKRKAWLHEKKMELRRLSFKQPDDIIAGENYMKRARRKLREARRRRREKDGGQSNDEEEEEEDGESDDSRDRSSSSERKDGKKDKKTANKDSKKRQGDRASERPRSGVNGAIGGPRSSEDEADDSDDDSEVGSTNVGVFNLKPTGRLSRPNPRSPVPGVELQASEQLTKKEIHLQKMAKVVRFPLESGFKLGRKIRKHRDKRKASSAHGSSTGGGDGDSQNGGEGEWGERVDSGQHRLQRRRRSSTSEADMFNRRRDDGVRVIVTNDSDRDDTDDSRSGGLGDADHIPELQESVGKKIRDRLAIRRPRWRSRNSTSSEGSEAEQDAKSGGEGDKSEKAKQKKKREKEKEKKEKDKKEKDKKEKEKKEKEKDKLEAKKTKKEQKAEDDKEVDTESTEKQKKTKKKDKKQKKSKEKDDFEVPSRTGLGHVNSALEFVELESD